MKLLLTTIGCSALVGLGLGATLALVELRPATPLPKQLNAIPTDAPASTLEDNALEDNAPRAEVPETLFHFGSIEEDASMSHDFIIRNVGGRLLKIEVGKTTCKCTVGDLSKSEIGPGEQTEVRLEWTAKTGPGPFRHGATLLTNDPLRSRIQLTVEGKVIASTTLLRPSVLNYGSTRVGETKEAKLRLISFVAEEIEVVEYEISGEELKSQMEVRFEPLGKDQLLVPGALSGIEILTTYRAGKKIGPIRGLLTLATHLGDSEKIRVPISSHVVGDISVYGPGWKAQQGLLQLGNIRRSAGKTVRLNLAVRGSHAKSTEFEVARVDPPELKVTLGERRVMNDKLLHVPLLIEVPVGIKPMVRLGGPASTDAVIVLRTTHPDVPEMQLRAHFSVGP